MLTQRNGGHSEASAECYPCSISAAQYLLLNIPSMKLALLVLTVSLAGFAQTRAIDFEKQKPEILSRYQALIRIDTSSPPGNETKAVEYLKGVLEAEGIPTQTFALNPSRANLVARLKGNGANARCSYWLTRMWFPFSAKSGRSIRSALFLRTATFGDGVRWTIVRS